MNAELGTERITPADVDKTRNLSLVEAAIALAEAHARLHYTQEPGPKRLLTQAYYDFGRAVAREAKA